MKWPVMPPVRARHKLVRIQLLPNLRFQMWALVPRTIETESMAHDSTVRRALVDSMWRYRSDIELGSMTRRVAHSILRLLVTKWSSGCGSLVGEKESRRC